VGTTGRLEERTELVVGVDGSAPSRAALRFAGEEARLRGYVLAVVMATAGLSDPAAPAATGSDQDMASPVTGLVAPAVDASRRRSPELAELAARLVRAMVEDELGTDRSLTIRTEAHDGSASKVLLGRSATAAGVVVGGRGNGGFPGLRMGSTADQVLHHASCTVIVVQQGQSSPEPGTASDSPVIVGVDGSDESRSALRFAAREARLRSTRLIVVGAYQPTDRFEMEALAGPHSPPGADPEPARLATVLGQLIAEEPETSGLDLEQAVQAGQPAKVLLESARDLDASILVVGTRGRGGFASLLLGSVSEEVSRHANCPVAVVRG